MVGHQFLIRPIQDSLSADQESVVELKTSIADLQRQISELSVESHEISFPSELMWKGASLSDAELKVQNAVVELSQRYDLTLVHFGSRAIDKNTSKDTVGFEFEANSSMDALYDFLVSLEAHEPRLAIGSLNIRPNTRYDDPSSSSVEVFSQIVLWSFWEESQ